MTGERIERIDWAWAFGAAVWATAFSAALSIWVFGRMPHVQDSIAQLFQARIFATGRLWAPAPPLPEFFEYAQMIIRDGRWYSQYPPGHPLLLLPGVWAGAPWLVNPILGGAAVVAVYFVGFEAAGRSVARLAVFLAANSPFLLLMSAGFMGHAGSLALLSFYLLFHFRALRRAAVVDGLAAGFCFGFALLIRPWTTVGFALPLWVHALIHLRRQPRRLLGPMFAAGAMAVAGGLVLLGYNAATNGSPFRFGYTVLYGDSHGLGFGKGTWGPAHTLARGLAQAGSQIRALDARLFEWPLSSLWPLLPAFWPGAWAVRSARRGVPRGWLLAIPISLAAVYVFYWYSDLCFGPRYLYEALAPLAVLSSVGILRLSGTIFRRGHPLPIAFALVLVFFLWGGATRWPDLFRMPPAAATADPGTPIRQASYFQHFGRQFWGVDPYIGETVREEVEPPALVFVRMLEGGSSRPPLRYLWFGSAFAWQRPDLSSAPVIFARDLGEHDRDLIGLYPERNLYLYQGSIESGELRRLR